MACLSVNFISSSVDLMYGLGNALFNSVVLLGPTNI